MSEIPNLDQIDEVLSPCCDEEIKVSEIGKKLKCPLCNTNLKQRAFLPFLEYLMENGHLENLDFFDLDLYNQDKEIEIKTDFFLPFYGLKTELCPISNWNLKLENNQIVVNS